MVCGGDGWGLGRERERESTKGKKDNKTRVWQGRYEKKKALTSYSELNSFFSCWIDSDLKIHTMIKIVPPLLWLGLRRGWIEQTEGWTGRFGWALFRVIKKCTGESPLRGQSFHETAEQKERCEKKNFWPQCKVEIVTYKNMQSKNI